MAKVKFSALVSEMRNKLNGSVFSKNRSGNYLRNKVTPINPKSPSQVAVRSILASLTQSFRSLTQAQIAAWNNAVQNFQSTDIFGDLINPSGINLYTKLNGNLVNAGQSALTNPPLPASVDQPAITGLTADSSPQTFDVASSLAAVPAGHTAVIEATPGMSPGRNFVKSEFRKIATMAAAATFPYSGAVTYQAKFGAMTAGQKVFVRVKFVNNSTGQVSQSEIASAIVA